MKTHDRLYYSVYRLPSRQLKLAMKRFYHGPKFEISTDSLSFTQIRHHPQITPQTDPFMTYLFSIEARICPSTPGLFVRMKDILLLRSVKDLIYDASTCRIPSVLLAMKICQDNWLHKFIHDFVDLHEINPLKTGEQLSFLRNA